jgi:hypothetical protein
MAVALGNGKMETSMKESTSMGSSRDKDYLLALFKDGSIRVNGSKAK